MKWLAGGDSTREMLGESNGMIPTTQVPRQQSSQSQVNSFYNECNRFKGIPVEFIPK